MENQQTQDWLSVSELAARYKVSKNVIHKRLRDLKIQTRRMADQACINRGQISLMDALNEFIGGGGTTAEFLFFRDDNREDSA